MQYCVRSGVWGALCSLLMAALAACNMPLSNPEDGAIAPAAMPSSDLSGELIVFAAASLTEAFGEISANFESAHPNMRVILNFAGSQQLAQQLGQGAPADLFAAANDRQMAAAIEATRVISGTPQTFVHNRLIAIYPDDNPAQIASLQDLARPGLKLVLAAPEVPVGAYTLDFLHKASISPDYDDTFGDAVQANVVSYEQNVKAVLSKVLLGEADAGIVYSSDVAGNAADQVGQLDIPDALNTIATYPIAPIADARNPDAAAAFIAYVLSPPGQQILASYGFIPAAQTPSTDG